MFSLQPPRHISTLPIRAATPMRPGGSYGGKTGHTSLWWARRFLTHRDISAGSFAVPHKIVLL
jgi:hypothetical protein